MPPQLDLSLDGSGERQRQKKINEKMNDGMGG